MLKRIWWDLETTDLNANWGNIICIGYQIEGEAIECLNIKDDRGWKPWDDSRLVARFLRVITREDVGLEVTHNGTLFDIPYLQARMARNGLGVFPVKGHFDTYFAAKSKLRIRGKSLGSCAEFLGVRFKKTPLSPETWRLAARGDEVALDYIAKHCRADVRVLRAVHDKIAPMMRRYPVMGGYNNCHFCDSPLLIKRGMYPTNYSGIQIAYSCKRCGKCGHMAQKTWAKR
jgi:uncharacterized protein YprB with RNaseH-like and TPR domain